MKMKRHIQRYAIAVLLHWRQQRVMYLPWDAVQKTSTLPLNKKSLDRVAVQLYPHAQIAFLTHNSHLAFLKLQATLHEAWIDPEGPLFCFSVLPDCGAVWGWVFLVLRGTVKRIGNRSNHIWQIVQCQVIFMKNNQEYFSVMLEIWKAVSTESYSHNLTVCIITTVHELFHTYSEKVMLM